jgi:hypothetical protein
LFVVGDGEHEFSRRVKDNALNPSIVRLAGRKSQIKGKTGVMRISYEFLQLTTTLALPKYDKLITSAGDKVGTRLRAGILK